LTEYRVSWRQVAGLTDDALSALIAADEIHVLVDLGGHTAGNRLGVFVRQPAPMQVGYLGYPTITGLPTIRFRITDWVVDPEPEEYSGSEAPLRLPDSYFCYRPPANAPNVGVRPNPGMFTFGSFNNLAKISPATLRLWAAVLKAVPASRLLLKNKSLADEVLRREFARRCADAGIDQNRLDLLAWQAATQSHLETYRDVDIALDTFPYNGATTSCEALWMGVPVVTRAGTTHASRMGASILRAAGHPQFVASTEERYVEICARLAEDRTLLAGLRRQARAHLSASALMDEPRFVAGFSAALRQAWKAQQHEG
jgi:predicted O-linked N-acetylglucosamine transferase (SPINDLY family)